MLKELGVTLGYVVRLMAEKKIICVFDNVRLFVTNSH